MLTTIDLLFSSEKIRATIYSGILFTKKSCHIYKPVSLFALKIGCLVSIIF